MNEDDKDKTDIENKEEEVKSEENQSEGESPQNDTQTQESSTSTTDNNEIQAEAQLGVEEKKEHEVIHKKDGRLHIYVRQDKYKGELKSKNWVGRLYIDGKQKISSSGTPNLDDAIPILEKWFDDVHANKGKEEKTSAETTDITTSEQPSTTPEPTTPPVVETPKATETAPAESVVTPLENKETSESKTSSSILEKFKNIKFKKPSFGKKDSSPKIVASGKSNFKQKIENDDNYSIGEFIGLLKLNSRGSKTFREIFSDLEKKHKGTFHDATSLSNAKLVDFLQEMIEREIIIHPEIINGKWCEIDTIQDLEIAKKMFKD